MVTLQMPEKRSEVDQENMTRWPKLLAVAAVTILSLLFLVAPFFKGLFFPGPKLAAMTIVFVVGAVYCGTHLLLRLQNSPESETSRPRPACLNLLDLAAIAYALSYWLAAISPAYFRAALEGGLQVTAYLVVYLIVSRSVSRSWWLGSLITHVWLAAGVYVATLGLGAYLGLIEYPDAVIGPRIASTLQYPNTLAIFLVAAAVLALNHAAVTRNWFLRAVYAATANLFMFTFVFTLSRGAFLTAPIALLIFFMGTRNNLKGRLLWLGIFSGIPAFLAFRGFYANAAIGDWNHGLRWLILSVGLAGIGALVQFAYETILGSYLERRPGRKSTLVSVRRWLYAGAAALLLLVAVGWFATHSVRETVAVTQEYLPGSVQERLEETNLEVRSVQQRFAYYRTALDLARDYPVFGTGAGGWATLYHAYQPYFYIAREVHNHFLQTAVEAGAVGLLSFLAVWAGLLLISWQVARHGSSRDNRVDHDFPWGPAAAAIALGGHSLIDFNLSFPAIGFMLWSLLGVVRSAAPVPTPGNSLNNRAFLIDLGMLLRTRRCLQAGITVVCLVSLVGFSALTYRLWVGARLTSEARELAGMGQVEEALGTYERSTTYDPWNADTFDDISRLLFREGAGTATTPEGLERALTASEKAVQLEPHYPLHRYQYVRVLLASEKNQKAVDQAESAVEAGTYRQEGYELLARAYFQHGLERLRSGAPDAASQVLQKLTDLPKGVDEVARQLQQYEPGELAEPQVRWTPYLALQVGKAYALLGHAEEAETHLVEAKEAPEWVIQADTWLYIAYVNSGQEDLAAAVAERPWIRFARDTAEFRELLELPIGVK